MQRTCAARCCDDGRRSITTPSSFVNLETFFIPLHTHSQTLLIVPLNSRHNHTGQQHQHQARPRPPPFFKSSTHTHTTTTPPSHTTHIKSKMVPRRLLLLVASFFICLQGFYALKDYHNIFCGKQNCYELLEVEPVCVCVCVCVLCLCIVYDE